MPDVSVGRWTIATAEAQPGELVSERWRQRESLRLVALDDLPLDLTTPRLSPPDVPGDVHTAALEFEVGPLQGEQLTLAKQQLERGADQRTPLERAGRGQHLVDLGDGQDALHALALRRTGAAGVYVCSGSRPTSDLA